MGIKTVISKFREYITLYMYMGHCYKYFANEYVEMLSSGTVSKWISDLSFEETNLKIYFGRFFSSLD